MGLWGPPKRFVGEQVLKQAMLLMFYMSRQGYKSVNSLFFQRKYQAGAKESKSASEG